MVLLEQMLLAVVAVVALEMYLVELAELAAAATELKAIKLERQAALILAVAAALAGLQQMFMLDKTAALDY
jgi:hypothetical protein